MSIRTYLTIAGSRHLRGAVIETMEELGFSVDVSKDWDQELYSIVYINIQKSEVGRCTKSSAILNSMFHIEGYEEITKFFEVIRSISQKNVIHIKNNI